MVLGFHHRLQNWVCHLPSPQRGKQGCLWEWCMEGTPATGLGQGREGGTLQSTCGWALARAVQPSLQNMKLGWTSLVSGFTSCSGLQPGTWSLGWGILGGDFQQLWQCEWSLAGFNICLATPVSGNQPIESAASVKQHWANKFLAVRKLKRLSKPESSLHSVSWRGRKKKSVSNSF